MTDSQQSLSEYVRSGSESAFRDLVDRYLNLVFTTALRRMEGDAHRAQDVAQTVFVDLARKAATLPGDVMLGGWLHRHTCFVASHALRSDRRRQLRERQAAEMHSMENDSGPDFSSLGPLLDDAVNELDDEDRTAILLRFFEQLDFRSLAAALGSNEDAARMRVRRALAKLETLLKHRGVTANSAALTAALTVGAVQAAPAGLAATISAAAVLSGTTLGAAVVATSAKVIAMTTLQKTVAAGTVVILLGYGVHETLQNTRLRQQVWTLEQRLAAYEAPRSAEAPPEPIVAEPAQQPSSVRGGTPSPENEEARWAARLLALNRGTWRDAFAVGQGLAALSPEMGFVILRDHWNSITNVPARQQLVKAFDFAEHPRLPAVLQMALLDPSSEVQSWALNYLKEVALQDFTTDYQSAVTWLSTRSEWPLASVFADAAQQAARTLSADDPSQVQAQLKLFRNASGLFAKHPDACTASGLDRVVAQLVRNQDSQIAILALEAAARLPFGEEWRRMHAFPLVSPGNPWKLRLAAADVLGVAGAEWAVPQLLELLSESVRLHERTGVWEIGRVLSTVGSPKAIPAMIALIEAENTYDTVYGLGYFALGKMTGVQYDEKHDGAWWRQWWENNKGRFPAEVQATEIPRLAPIPSREAAAAAAPSARDATPQR
jgi:RNA polymerase sigma factor (sigma-70 family)